MPVPSSFQDNRPGKRPAAERQRQSQLVARLGWIEAQLRKATAGEERRRLLAEQLKVQDELASFSRRLEEKYGPAAGQVLPTAELQKALPADGAFVTWVDFEGLVQTLTRLWVGSLRPLRSSGTNHGPA